MTSRQRYVQKRAKELYLHRPEWDVIVENLGYNIYYDFSLKKFVASHEVYGEYIETKESDILVMLDEIVSSFPRKKTA